VCNFYLQVLKMRREFHAHCCLSILFSVFVRAESRPGPAHQRVCNKGASWNPFRHARRTKSRPQTADNELHSILYSSHKLCNWYKSVHWQIINESGGFFAAVQFAEIITQHTSSWAQTEGKSTLLLGFPLFKSNYVCPFVFSSTYLKQKNTKYEGLHAG